MCPLTGPLFLVCILVVYGKTILISVFCVFLPYICRKVKSFFIKKEVRSDIKPDIK